MKKIIINADDFGLTDGVNKGIIESFKNGVVSSTTLMVNQPFAEEAVHLAHQNPKLAIGIHLTFDKGISLTGVSSLTDENGAFKLIVGRTTVDDFYQEIVAQHKKFKQLMGKEPSHMDSHHHVHVRNPQAFEAIQKFHKEINIPYRNELEFVSGFYGELISEELFINIITKKDQSNTTNIMEVMTHPGFNDKNLENTSSYTTLREKEIEILTSDKIKNFIKENYILSTY